jgi:hypothetical protein
MHVKTILLITGLLCALLAIAGCTGTQNAPVTQATVPATTQTASPTLAGPDLVVSPTDSIIEANRVNVNVDKDYLGNVIVTFQGGNGLHMVNTIDVTLIRADGVVKTSEVGIMVGDSRTLEGTKDTDRVMVNVTMKDGKRYKIVDSLMPFRPRT